MLKKAEGNEGRCLVVLPTYQERENIASVVIAVLGASTLADALVVDDGSPDGTAGVVRSMMVDEPRLFLNERFGKQGLGGAYLIGFRHALGRGYGSVCTMDADGSHDPLKLNSMLKRLRRESADIVIGSRYVSGGRIENWPPMRRILSAGANFLYRAVLRIDAADCTSGYRVYSNAILEKMRLTEMKSTGYSTLVELLWEATARGAKVLEEPIVFKDRAHGKSKVNFNEILGSLQTLAALRFSKAG